MNSSPRTISLSKEIAGIIALAVVLGLLYNVFSPNGIPLIRKSPTKVAVSDSALFAPTTDSLRQSLLNDTSRLPGVKVIAPLHEQALAGKGPAAAGVQSEPAYKVVTLGQVKKILAQGKAVFIDAREPEEYKKGHIAGARNIPAMEEDQHFPDLVQIPRDTLIVVYCNNAECHLGRMLTEFLATMEFKRLFLYDDGWDGWTKAGMPIDSTTGAP